MLLSEAFPCAKNKHHGDRYEIIGEVIAQRFKVKLKCLICSEIVDGLPSAIFTGRLACNCRKKNGGSTSVKKLERILPLIKSKNITLFTDIIPSAKAPLPAICNICEYTWETSYNSLFYKKHGCPKCSNSIRPTQVEFENQVSKLCDKLSLTFISSDFSEDLKLKYAKVTLECKVCALVWKTSKASLSGGSSCPNCASSGFNSGAPAYLYILRVCSSENILLGYKYGITSDIQRRISQHVKYSVSADLHFELAWSWYYKKGSDAMAHEKLIKKTFSSYFLKEELPSGYTESIPIQSLPDLLDMQILQYKEENYGRIK